MKTLARACPATPDVSTCREPVDGCQTVPNVAAWGKRGMITDQPLLYAGRASRPAIV